MCYFSTILSSGLITKYNLSWWNYNVFGYKTKYWTQNLSRHQCYMDSQGMRKVITIHPKRDKNVCTKFHDNPFTSC